MHLWPELSRFSGKLSRVHRCVSTGSSLALRIAMDGKGDGDSAARVDKWPVSRLSEGGMGGYLAYGVVCVPFGKSHDMIFPMSLSLTHIFYFLQLICYFGGCASICSALKINLLHGCTAVFLRPQFASPWSTDPSRSPRSPQAPSLFPS